MLDYSSQIVAGSTLEDIDPLKIERLRQTIDRLHGDPELLSLDDTQRMQALRLVETMGKRLIPNIAGLLPPGRESAIRRHLPTHETAFQVLDPQGEASVNDWFYDPLLKMLDAVERRFNAISQKREVNFGRFRQGHFIMDPGD